MYLLWNPILFFIKNKPGKRPFFLFSSLSKSKSGLSNKRLVCRLACGITLSCYHSDMVSLNFPNKNISEFKRLLKQTIWLSVEISNISVTVKAFIRRLQLQ